jgi:hypothetical protein
VTVSQEAQPMTQDESPLPPEPTLPPRTRRRRRGQLEVPRDAEGRAALLHSLSHRAYPSVELFVLAVLCGAILGLGYFFDSQAVLIFGILLAPLLTPWIGLLLSALTGSLRYFFETFMALLISSALIFLSGLLAGVAVRVVPPRTSYEAFLHSHLWWLDLTVLALGAVILAISFVRSEDRPYLPSVMVAYEFFLPLSASGFGLGSGVPGIWPNGLLVFFVNFAWAGLFGILTLIALKFLPANLKGFVLSAGSSAIFVVIVVYLMTGGKWTIPSLTRPLPPTSLPTLTLSVPTVSTATSTLEASPAKTFTPAIDTITATISSTDTPTITSTPEATLPPNETATVTLTIAPTPVYARVNAYPQGGANLRKDPNGTFIIEVDNGSVVEVQPDTQDVNGVVWAHVIAIRNDQRYDGWVLQSALEMATPAPIWNPTTTPLNTDTPTVTPTP